VLAQSSIASDRPGYAQALRFAREQAEGARLWALEGAGHDGAGLARYLSERGETVLEVGRSPRSGRRLRGKDDRLDAVRAARSALSNELLPRPRRGSGARPCGCCCSPAAVRSRPAARRSCSCAACS